MFQETGTAILARARIKAQDNDANSNFAVSDADALILLNDILVALTNDVATKTKWVAASVSGLTFTAGTASKLTTADINATEIESFHQASSSSLVYPVSPALQRVTVQEILEMFDYDGNTPPSQAASEWTHVAAEKAQNDTAGGVEYWRVYAFPVINTTRYIHLKVPAPITISALTDTPDVDSVDSRVLSSLLAFRMAKLKKETSQAFLAGIAEEIPPAVMQRVYGNAVKSSQLQSSVLRRNG